MIDIDCKIEYGGQWMRVVAIFDQPTVVLENSDGERATVALVKLVHNRMRHPEARTPSTQEGEQ